MRLPAKAENFVAQGSEASDTEPGNLTLGYCHLGPLTADVRSSELQQGYDVRLQKAKQW